MRRNNASVSRVFASSMIWILGICSVATANTVYDQTAQGIPGVVAYWNFEDASSGAGQTAADSTGNHNGVYQGNVTMTSDTPGPGSAKAANFSAGASSIDSIATTGMPAGSADRSLVFWMKSGPIAPNSSQVALEYGTANYGEAFGAGLIDGSSWGLPGTRVFASQYGNLIQSPLVDGNWHMYTVMVRFGSASPQWTLWQDGANLIGNTGFSTDTVLAPQAVIGGSGYVGLLDNMAIYNVGLTETQMNSLYTTMTVPEPSTLAISVTSIVGLLAYAWRRRK